MGGLTSKLDIYTFGSQLLATEDLDPLYVGLYKAKLPPEQLYRYLLAYWLVYHVGVSAHLSEFEGCAFWERCLVVAANSIPPSEFQLPGDRWPRGVERRHFRGQRCVAATKQLQACFPKPEDAVGSLLNGSGVGASADSVMELVKGWPLFGPWIAWKVVDMLERCAGAPISLDKNLVLMYAEPRKALAILSQYSGRSEKAHWQELLAWVQQFKAPPAYDRLCGPAEQETINCKWKSYLGGHYWIGKDIKEQRHGLTGWGSTAKKLLSNYPPPVLPPGMLF